MAKAVSIKQKIKDGKLVFGTWIRTPSPITVEVLGRAGFDFLHLDLEHSSIDLGILDSMVLAGYSTGTPLTVRTATQNPADFYRIMDIGISSFILPRMETAEQCAALLSGIRYAPAGIRGLGGPVRGNGWGTISLDQHMKDAEEATMVLVQIESKKGLDNMEEILNVPGIDVLYIGPFDLSSALGYPGQVDHPVVLDTIHQMVSAIKQKGIAVGIHVSSKEQAEYWAQHGIQYITVGLDVTLLLSAGMTLTESMKGISKE